ncbi:hypothetical protein MMC28_007784 [Mycoblastus sanguinarius]|nr:hypothetical protein [Mycoblastus sanguinarius]
MPRERDHYPTNVDDCEGAIRELIRNRDLDRPLSFSRQAGCDFRLPVSFSSGTCVIMLYMDNYRDRDTMKLLDVEDAALSLAAQCASSSEPPALGGRRTVGAQDLLNMIMYGRIWPPAGEVVEK